MERGGVTINLKHLIKYFTHQGIKVSLISNNINKKNFNIKKENFFFFKYPLEQKIYFFQIDGLKR